ncbi:type I toxin-antitoxin system SymE family toxin [Yersinia entomophaga]|nr:MULTISPECIES: type I toxin-antitoxin system SymE family toxin [Yersinia]
MTGQPLVISVMPGQVVIRIQQSCMCTDIS